MVQACVLLLAMIITTQVYATRWTPWIKASEVYPDGAPVPGTDVKIKPADLHPDLGPFMWYCAGGSAECPDEKNNLVHFQYRFDTKDFLWKEEQALGIHSFDGGIQADDFFALYINGKLALHNWLDDLAPAPKGAREPVSFNHLGGVKLGANVIDIIACDGYPPDPRIIPGPSLDQANIACPQPSDRENNYVTFFADVTLNLEGDEISHNWIFSGSEWDARALPEPATISLVFAGFMGIFLRRRIKLTQVAH